MFDSLRMAFVNSVLASPLTHFRVRTLAFIVLGLQVAPRSRVFAGVTIRTSKLRIGQRSTVNSGTFIDNRALVTIGDRVGIGPNVSILTGSHAYDDPNCRAGLGMLQAVVIEDGVWVGCNAAILPGVTIARGCVIASGAVVTKDTEPHGLYVGVPARRFRDLPTATAPGSISSDLGMTE